MTIRLSSGAEMIVEHLTWGCRCSTIDHLQRIFAAHGCNAEAALPTVKRLAAAGMVQSRTAAVVFPLPMEPLWVWPSGGRVPDCNALAWKLEKRWHACPPRRVTMCWATEKAARLFGGTAHFLQHGTQMEHDLGTAAILVRLHETAPDQAAQWISEDILRRDYSGLRAIPDAALVENGRIIKWIEYGGQYRAGRLNRLHRHCRTIPYELW